MASLTAFFKPVASPKKVSAAAAAVSTDANASSELGSPKSRKRKAASPDDTKDANADAAAPASAAALQKAMDPTATPAEVAAASSSNTLSVPNNGSGPETAESPAKKPKLDQNSLAALISPSWAAVLAPEFNKSYFTGIEKFLKAQATAGAKVFPERKNIFRALDLCPLENVKVVILGQDPYHDDGQAEGLCFSVPPDVKKIPPSLVNIYKELGTDIPGFKKPTHGHLVKWAQQGILLLNTGLTVQAHKANSHKSAGWAEFTDAIIKAVAKNRRGVVFVLWGAHAQSKEKLIDAARHHVLKGVHPSPLSASKGFFGCKHFSKCNTFLVKDGQTPIDWQV